MGEESTEDQHGSIDITINDRRYHFAPSWRNPKSSLIFFVLLMVFILGLTFLLVGVVYGLMALGTGMGLLFGQQASFTTFLNADFFGGCLITSALGLIVYGLIFSWNKESKKDTPSITAKL